MTSFETPRLVIRNFKPEDWRLLKELIIWFNASEYAAYDHPWPASDRKIKELCRRFAANGGYFAVLIKSTHDFIGYISLVQTETPGVYNLGYCVNAAFHGQGYATESCRAALRYAFEKLGASKIISGTASENIPSCALLHKLGFKMTGSAVFSFHRDKHGVPIEFLGCQYELGRPAAIE